MKAVSLVEVKVVVMVRMMDCLSALCLVEKMDQMTVRKTGCLMDANLD